jgi:hypothetical protein
MKRTRKIRLGDRVEHAIEDYGIGTVWELRPNGFVSVHWDRDWPMTVVAGVSTLRVEHRSKGYNKRHHKAGSLIFAL